MWFQGRYSINKKI